MSIVIKVEIGDPYLDKKGRMCLDINICGMVTSYFIVHINDDGTYLLKEIGEIC